MTSYKIYTTEATADEETLSYMDGGNVWCNVTRVSYSDAGTRVSEFSDAKIENKFIIRFVADPTADDTVDPFRATFTDKPDGVWGYSVDQLVDVLLGASPSMRYMSSDIIIDGDDVVFGANYENSQFRVNRYWLYNVICYALLHDN